MNNVERITLPKVVSMLNACKVQFAIIDSDGKQYGNLEVVAKKKRRPLKYPFGALANHFTPYIKDLKADQAAEVPCQDYDMESMRSAIAGWASSHWGNGACSTMLDKKTNTVLVFRVEQKDYLPF
jgi:hypothetical protein